MWVLIWSVLTRWWIWFNVKRCVSPSPHSWFFIIFVALAQSGFLLWRWPAQSTYIIPDCIKCLCNPSVSFQSHVDSGSVLLCIFIVADSSWCLKNTESQTASRASYNITDFPRCLSGLSGFHSYHSILVWNFKENC